MEGVFFKYSEFYEDDGGFDQIRKDFDKLGDDLQRRAREIKSSVQIFDLDNVEGIKEFESETESLTKAFKKYGDAKSDINKIEEAYRKEVEKVNQSNDDQIERLIELDKKLQTYRSELKEVNTLSKQGIKTDRDLNKERVEAQLNIKNVSKEIRDQQKEVLKSNDLSRKEQKLIEARIVLQKEEIRNRDELRDRIKALRIVVDSLDFETQADEIKQYNAEINELTQALSDNSDKFIQSKINIGNYEESITNALKGTNLFQGELSALNGVVDKLIGFLSNSEKANDSDAKAKRANSKATTSLTKSIRVLNRVAKATVILALVAAIASLAAVFSQGRSGAIATAQALARFQASARVLINVAAEVGKGILTIFEGIGKSFGSFFDRVELLFLRAQRQIASLPELIGGSAEKVEDLTNRIDKLQASVDENSSENTKYAEGWDQITKAVGSASQRIEDAKAAIDTLDEGAIRAFEIADEIREAELGLIALRKEVRLLEIQSEDSTRSLTQQLEATDELLEKRVELLEREADISLKNLELANARARADAEASGFRLSEDDVQFARELLDLNIQLSERQGNNPLDDNLLEETQTALREYLSLLDEVEIAEEEIGKQRREIQRDLFEQNLDLLIDLIDTEKNISEQLVNDTTLSFRNRIDEFNRFLVVFRQNAQKELNEFNKLAENSAELLRERISSGRLAGDQLESAREQLKQLENIDFEINFLEDGSFEILNNGIELSLDNIVELNKELQSLGIAEIPINRFREFNIETANAVRDFRDLNKELGLVAINVRELSENVSVSQDELNALDNLQQRIDKLANTSRGNLSRSERESILKEIEELEKQKTAIEEFAEFQRLNNRKEAIDAELQTVEEESQRYYELLQERLDIEKQLRDKGVTDTINSEKEKNKKIIEEQKKAAEETRKIIDAVLDRALEAQQKRVEGAEERVDRQNELVDIQRQRAEQGLENTLAFEQRELGKREAERIKEEKRQERLEKIRALYTSYSNYASRGDENPIVSALRDFAILETISASFGEGGVVEDKLPTNGIFRGRSHQGRQGGIPILVEGREGIFSGREMENLGKENFYKMKDLASMGKVDSNFFSRQRESFVSGIPVSNTNPELISEMREVKKAIQSKPVQTWNASQIVNGTMDLVETILTKNQTKRNHYKTKKPRL